MIVFDQGIKLVLGKFFPNILIYNREIIFGSLNLSNSLLYLIFSLLLVLVFIIIEKPQRDEKFSLLGVVFILSGIASNLLDRLLKGAVLDYLKFGNLFFNLADIAIIIGLVIYIQQKLCQKQKKSSF